MKLNKLKARAETAQVMSQLVLPKDDIPTSDTPIVGNTQREVQRESRWRTLANWLAGNPKVAFGQSLAGHYTDRAGCLCPGSCRRARISIDRIRCRIPGDDRLGRHWPGCWLLWRPGR